MADFQVCSCCHARWASRDQFIDDPAVVPIGYQVDFLNLTGGYLLFTHTPEACGSTLALEVERFVDMYDGPRHDEDLFGTAECGGRCGRLDDLSRCERACRNAWVRELVAGIVERKAGSAS